MPPTRRQSYGHLLFLILGVLLGLAALLPHREQSSPISAKPFAQTQASDRQGRPSEVPPAFLQNLPRAACFNAADPAERLVADCKLLRDVWREAGTGRWIREAVLRCPVTGQKLGCREVWRFGKDTVKPELQRRQLFSGEHVLVQIINTATERDLPLLLAPLGFNLREKIAAGLFVVSLPATELLTVGEAEEEIRALGIPGLSARPDAIGFGAAVPNDPIFPDTYGGFWGQWNLRNTGARSNSVTGTDIAAVPAWDILQTARGVTIAVLDSGLRTNHPDLAGLSCRGTNIVATNSDLTDDERLYGGHGTGVTAIMGANRNNGIGFAGIAGSADYLIIKVLNQTNYGTTADVIKGLDYARSNGASIVNMSLVNFPNDPSLRDAIARCEANGILLCISAGNKGADNDAQPNYPSSFTNANIISVGGHDWSDQRWAGGTDTNAPSNYGASSVDLFAPGVFVPSAAQTNAAQNNDYLWWTGTSVATPHVAGTAAVIKSLNPGWTALQIKSAILSSVATNANYAGLCVSGGRLDALKAIGRAITQGPSNDNDGDESDNLLEYLAGTRTDDFSSKPRVTGQLDGAYFGVTMPRVVRADAHLVAEKSPALGAVTSWSTNGVSEASDTSMFRASIPHAGLEKAFLRIKGKTSP